MNTDANIFSMRLRQARVMRGMSLDALSKSVGNVISRQAIHKYEMGKMMPDSEILIGLSKALGVKVDFFFRPYRVEVGQLQFRKNEKFSNQNINALKAKVQEELERYLEIEQLGGEQSQFELIRKPVDSNQVARRLAIEVRESFKLGYDGISNVIEVFEDNGIKVIEVDEGDNFKGLSGFINAKIPFIVVNTTLSPEQKRFTLLHELGHLLMLPTDNLSQKEIESLCNVFASEMLIPSSVIVKKIGDNRHDISLAELIDIQLQFGISIDALMCTLRQQGVISENRFKTYNLKKNTIPSFRTEVEKSRTVNEKSGRFLRMVFRALADEVISISKAASLLNMSVDRIQSQLQLV